MNSIAVIDTVSLLSVLGALYFFVSGRKTTKISSVAHCIVFTLLFLTFIHDLGNVFEYGGITRYFDTEVEGPLKVVLSVTWLLFLVIALRDIEISGHIKTRKTLNRYMNTLKNIINASRQLTSTTEPGLLYRKITLYTKEIFQLDFSTLMLLSEDRNQLIIKDTLGFSHSMINTFGLVEGQGLSTFVLKKGSADQVIDFREEDRFEVPSVVFEKGITSAIAAPMIVEDEPIGVLIGHTLKRRKFSEDELEVFQALANHAALAIKNALSLRELSRERTQLRALFDAIPDLIFRISSDGIILQYKPAQNIPLFRRPEEFIGKPLTDLLPEDVSDATMNALKNALSTQNMVVFNYRLPFPDRLRYFEARLVPVTEKEAVALIRDFTDWIETQNRLKKYQTDLEAIVEERTRELKERIGEIELLNKGMMNLLEDLREANRKLEITTKSLRESNEELEGFAYSVSHDLRAPLRAMQGFSEALLEDYSDRLDAQGLEYARRIQEAAKRMDNLILDLLSYSRITRADIRLQPVKLEGVIKEAITQLSEFIDEKGAKVSVSDRLPTVKATHSIALQIFTNLISNAIKFSRPDVTPEVKIYSVDSDDNRVRVFVQDNGIGIKPEHFDRIFRIFERLHGIETYPGTGIGLAIVRKGAEKVGGTVGVESTPGRGSRFWVEFQKWKSEGASDGDQKTDTLG